MYTVCIVGTITETASKKIGISNGTFFISLEPISFFKGGCNMLCNVIIDINIQLSQNYVSRGKHPLPQYRRHFWPRPETDNMYFIY